MEKERETETERRMKKNEKIEMSCFLEIFPNSKKDEIKIQAFR